MPLPRDSAHPVSHSSMTQCNFWLTYRGLADDDVMSVLNYYTGSDPEPGRNKQYQLGMLNARIFAAERQASILLRSQAHMIAHRRDRAGRRER